MFPTTSRGSRARVAMVAASAVAAIALLAGCSGGGSAPKKTSAPLDLTIAETTAPTTLDPHASGLLADRYAWQLAYECLLTTDTKGEIRPALATKYTVSSDVLTYTFTLRQGVTFHNGDPLTVEDVVYSFNRLKSTKLNLSARNYPTLDTVTASGDDKVVFKLKTADAGFLANMANPVVNACAIMDHATGDDPAAATQMNGTGVWKQTDYRANTSLALERNPKYWGTKAKAEKLTVLYMPTSSTQTSALTAGKVDLIFPDQPGSQLLSKNPKVAVQTGPGSGLVILQINDTTAPFNDPKVRQALALAVNRKDLADQAYHGAAKASGPIPTTYAWSTKLADLPNSKTDVAKAKKLLAQAGHPDGISTSIMYLSNYDSGTNDLMVALQAQLAKANITVELQPLELPVLAQKLTHVDYGLSWNTSNGVSNPYQFVQPQPGRQGPAPADLQKLFDTALKAPSPDAYHDALNVAQKKEMEIVYPTLPLITLDIFVAAKKELTGVEVPTNGTRAFLAGITKG